jgi:hypothetical protein
LFYEEIGRKAGDAIAARRAGIPPLRGSRVNWKFVRAGGATNLYKARLVDADLSGANLSSANLQKANLRGAVLQSTVLSNVDLRDTNGLNACNHRGPSLIGLDTFAKSNGKIPNEFLRGCGLADWEIELAGLYRPDLTIDYATGIAYRIAQLRPADPSKFYSSFISYSHADKPFARRLYDRLQSRGIRCWLDEKQLRPGDDIYQQIDRGIHLWDKVLLCCSEHSLKPGSWVDKEIVVALQKEDELTRQRGEKVLALIPLNLDGYLFSDSWKSGYRAEIRRRVAADFTGWKNSGRKFEAQVDNVVRALRADDSGRENPPESRL